MAKHLGRAFASFADDVVRTLEVVVGIVKRHTKWNGDELDRHNS